MASVVVLFNAGAVQVGIDDFSVLTFGSRPVLVKGPDTPWDATCQLALLEQINCRKGAWAAATSMAAASPASDLAHHDHAVDAAAMAVAEGGRSGCIV